MQIIFNYLINLQDDGDRWKRQKCCNHCSLNLWDDKGRFSLLKIYNVFGREWSLFTYYLRHRHPPYFGAWVNGGDNETHLFSKIVNWLKMLMKYVINLDFLILMNTMKNFGKVIFQMKLSELVCHLE